MRNKKGWIKIVEAFIAVVLIAVILMSFYYPKKAGSNQDIVKIEDSLLGEIAGNAGLRQDVLNGDNASIISFVSEKIPSYLDFEIRICPVDDVCAMNLYRKEVYARERVISGTLQEYSPKKLRIFMWEK